jgi:D-alanyl-lipoteichoic acid acyltransferase DltB (MBOAT superfamily)
MLPTLKEFLQIFFTFSVVTFTWIFFRSTTVSDAFNYIGGIFSSSILSPVDTSAFINGNMHYIVALLLVAFFMIIEWMGRRNDYALRKMFLQVATPVRWTAYYFFVVCIFLFFGREKQFIYFQF